MVLLDINMPKTGLEVLAEIKADPRFRAPVVILTVSEREDIVRSFRQGACSYIRKPVVYPLYRRRQEFRAVLDPGLPRFPTLKR